MLSEQYVKDVCKIGQGHETCRYLAGLPGAMGCAKLTPLKAVLDARGDTMGARGDNCRGIVT